jgi:hypothetical protein
MKHLKIAGLCLVAMLTMSIAMAATASAAPVWEECATEKAGTAATKYTEHLCNTASGSGGWAWQEVPATAPKAIRFRGTLTLMDTKTPLGESEVECFAEGEGVAGGSIGKVEKVTAIHCRGIKVCEGEPTVKAVGLPWETEFLETEKMAMQDLKGTTNGEPGWNVKCKVSGVEVEDECRSEKGVPQHLLDENRVTKSEMLILETVRESSNKGDCKQGGKGTGTVVVSNAYLFTEGSASRVS